MSRVGSTSASSADPDVDFVRFLEDFAAGPALLMEAPWGMHVSRVECSLVAVFLLPFDKATVVGPYCEGFVCDLSFALWSFERRPSM